VNATYVFERGTSRSSDDSSRLQAGGFWNDSAVSSHGNSSVHAHKRVVAQKQLVSCMARLVNTVVFLPAALCRGTHRNTIQFATCKRTTHTFFGNGQKVETTPSPAPNKDRPFIPIPGRQRLSGRGRGKHKL
jgi:hypothetical protein